MLPCWQRGFGGLLPRALGGVIGVARYAQAL